MSAGVHASFPPRSTHVGVMLAGGGVGAGVAAGVSMALGAAGPTSSLAVLVVLIAGVLGLVPALMHISPSAWGLAVLGGSMARALAALAIGLALDKTRPLDREGFWMGLVAGLLVMLIIEVAFAVRALQQLEASIRVESGGSAGNAVGPQKKEQAPTP